MIKKFAIKELGFRISMIILLLVSFSYFISQLNMIKKKNSTTNIKQQENQIQNNKELLNQDVTHQDATHQDVTRQDATRQDVTLRNVEKINTYIDEQSFLLSTLEQNDKKIEPLLKSIEDNILLIEKEAKSKSVNNLINQTKIDEIKNSLASYKQIPTKIKRNI